MITITTEQLNDWLSEKRAKIEEINNVIARIDSVIAGDDNQSARDEEIILAALEMRRKAWETQIQEILRNHPEAAKQAGYTQELIALLA